MIQEMGTFNNGQHISKFDGEESEVDLELED